MNGVPRSAAPRSAAFTCGTRPGRSTGTTRMCGSASTNSTNGAGERASATMQGTSKAASATSARRSSASSAGSLAHVIVAIDTSSGRIGGAGSGLLSVCEPPGEDASQQQRDSDDEQDRYDPAAHAPDRFPDLLVEVVAVGSRLADDRPLAQPPQPEAFRDADVLQRLRRGGTRCAGLS